MASPRWHPLAMWTLLSLSAPLAATGPTTWTVDEAGTGDFLTIEEALEVIAPGDIVEVEPGVYDERLRIVIDVTLRSTQGRDVTTIRDGWQNSLILIEEEAHVVIEGFEITTNVIPQHCVKVRENGVLELTDVYIHGCDAYDGLGGGLRSEPGVLTTIRDSVFEDNYAHWTIAAQAAHIYSRGDLLDIDNTEFRGGISEGGGAAMQIIGPEAIITNSLFVDNYAWRDGGALFVDGRATTFPDSAYSVGTQSLTVTGNTFINNRADLKGGAVFMVLVPEYEFSDNVFCGNSSEGRGGAFYIDPAPAAVGDGVLHHNIIADNASNDQGGGVFVLGGEAVFEHNTFVGNSAALEGGAIGLKQGTLHLEHNVFAHSDGYGVWFNQPENFTGALDWNLWWANLPSDIEVNTPLGPADAFADPVFTTLSLDGDCTNDDFLPRVGSPLIDAGDPTLTEVDGTAPDIGAITTAAPTTPGTGTTTPPTTGSTPGTTGVGTTPPTGAGTGPTSPPTTSGTDGQTDGGTAANGGTSAGGCGCSAIGAPTTGLLWMVAALLGWRRRQDVP